MARTKRVYAFRRFLLPLSVTGPYKYGMRRVRRVLLEGRAQSGDVDALGRSLPVGHLVHRSRTARTLVTEPAPFAASNVVSPAVEPELAHPAPAPLVPAAPVAHRPMRQCRAPAREADLPPCTQAVVYTGKAHGNDRLAECTWSPADCPAAGVALVLWFTPQALARHAALGLSVVVTFHDEHGRWRPVTVACESLRVPGEYGLFAACRMAPGEAAGALLDGRLLCRGTERSPAMLAAQLAARSSVATQRYAFELEKGAIVSLYDGRACRPGGPKRANCADTTSDANCALHVDGWFVTSREVPALAACGSRTSRAQAELLWLYGVAYWQAHAHLSP